MTDNAYTVTEPSPGKVKVSSKAVKAELDKHKTKTWSQLSTNEKLDILASFLGITPDTNVTDATTIVRSHLGQ